MLTKTKAFPQNIIAAQELNCNNFAVKASNLGHFLVK